MDLIIFYTSIKSKKTRSKRMLHNAIASYVYLTSLKELTNFESLPLIPQKLRRDIDILKEQGHKKVLHHIIQKKTLNCLFKILPKTSLKHTAFLSFRCTDPVPYFNLQRQDFSITTTMAIYQHIRAGVERNNK